MLQCVGFPRRLPLPRQDQDPCLVQDTSNQARIARLTLLSSARRNKNESERMEQVGKNKGDEKLTSSSSSGPSPRGYDFFVALISMSTA